ncbi:hypothetical protein FRC00_001652 [Tulasnella sp. 408]|nr:hypothetical protein FRC00_001652 [Tulasnella sp. 408]
MTDSFQLFKKGKHTAWPLLFVNNNLDPKIRYELSNTVCVGLIPGPCKPMEHDSFMYVVVEDLAKAALGVSTYDAMEDEMFMLWVYCHWESGDTPAGTSAYSRGKHHGAQHPCCICPIEGIRIQGSINLSYYPPIICLTGYPPSQFTLADLPVRTHAEYLRQAKEVDNARTQSEQKRLSQLYRINYTPITSKIPGFTFPWSLPLEFLHLLENSTSNYIELILGNFKGFDAGVHPYIIADNVWKEIGTATVQANATIPSTFGQRIPNVAEDRMYMTAEAHLVWTTLYTPILLCGCFEHNRYYELWNKFVWIVNCCLQFSLSKKERDKLPCNIHVWYTEYEAYVYFIYSILFSPSLILHLDFSISIAQTSWQHVSSQYTPGSIFRMSSKTVGLFGLTALG